LLARSSGSVAAEAVERVFTQLCPMSGVLRGAARRSGGYYIVVGADLHEQRAGQAAGERSRTVKGHLKCVVGAYLVACGRVSHRGVDLLSTGAVIIAVEPG
jgi:hypothetical protein